MPPTAFIFSFVLLYLPLGVLVSLTALIMHFVEKYKKYSMPVVAVYIAAPAVLALVSVVMLPVLLLMVGFVYLVENYWAVATITSLRMTMVFVFVTLYVVLSLLSVAKVCPFVWHWVLQKWPGGFSIVTTASSKNND